MAINDPQTTAALQAIASGNLPPQAANALLQSGKISYAQYQDATGQGKPPPAPSAIPVPPTVTTGPDMDPGSYAPPGLVVAPVEGNANPATAGMSPDQIAAQQRAESTGQNTSAPKPGAPPGGLVFAKAPQGAAPGGAPATMDLGGFGPTVMTPGGFIPSSRATQTTSGVNYSPDTKAAVARSTQAGEDVDKALTDVTTAESEEEKRRQAILATTAQGELASYNVAKARQDSERGWQMDKIASAQRDLDEATARGTDPHRWFANKSTGSKIALGIGLLASGFVQGTKGGPNVVLDQINKEIDRDIDAQKDTVGAKKEALQGQINMYGLLRQKGLDEDAARDGAKLLAHQQLDATMKANMTQASDAKGKLALAQGIQENQAKIAGLRGKMDEQASSRTSTNSSEVYRPPSVTGGNITRQKILADAKELYEKNYGKQGNAYPDALRAAFRNATGKDPTPGELEPLISDAPKPGQAGRLAKPMMQAQSNVAELDELARLSRSTVQSAQEAARASQILQSLRANGVEGLPEDSSMFSAGRFTGSAQAAIDQARRGQVARLQAAKDIVAGGGGATDPETSTPEGFSEDE